MANKVKLKTLVEKMNLKNLSKKCLTNSNECDIINKLSQERHKVP